MLDRYALQGCLRDCWAGFCSTLFAGRADSWHTLAEVESGVFARVLRGSSSSISTMLTLATPGHRPLAESAVAAVAAVRLTMFQHKHSSIDLSLLPRFFLPPPHISLAVHRRGLYLSYVAAPLICPSSSCLFWGCQLRERVSRVVTNGVCTAAECRKRAALPQLSHRSPMPQLWEAHTLGVGITPRRKKR